MGRCQHAKSPSASDDAHVGMVDRKLAGGVHHVGNHDGSYDAAFSCPDVSVLCGAEPESERRDENASFCFGLSRIVDCVQCCGDCRPMGAAVDRLDITYDRGQVVRSQWRIAADCRAISV